MKKIAARFAGDQWNEASFLAVMLSVLVLTTAGYPPSNARLNGHAFARRPSISGGDDTGRACGVSCSW